MQNHAVEHIWLIADRSLRHAVLRGRPHTFLCGKLVRAASRRAVEFGLPHDNVRCARCDRARIAAETKRPDVI
jgi:hypothetical protein